MTADQRQAFKSQGVRYGVQWLQRITYKNAVFWKMHINECCLISFIERTHFCGRASSEGFENKHYQMAALKVLLAPMVGTSGRVNKLSQRQQIFLLPGLHERFEKIREKTNSTGPRGSYKTGVQTRNEEDVVILDDIEDDAPNGFICIEDGALLDDKFAEFYNFYKRSQVPDEWHEPLRQNKKLGNKAVHDSKYLK